MIHKTAIVDNKAKVSNSVNIGAYCVIGPNVEIGKDVVIHSHVNISSVLAGIVKNIMLILGLITALGTLGVNISAIVAGLGLTGFAFGFAFKDMLSSFISGIMIFIYQPFQLGDEIEVDKKRGKVVDINLRYVTLQGENSIMLIPNSLLVSKSLEVVKKPKS